MKASFALCSKRVWRTDDRSSQRLRDKATDLIAKGTDLGPDLRLVHFFIPSFIYLSIFSQCNRCGVPCFKGWNA